MHHKIIILKFIKKFTKTPASHDEHEEYDY